MVGTVVLFHFHKIGNWTLFLNYLKLFVSFEYCNCSYHILVLKFKLTVILKVKFWQLKLF